MAEAKCVWCTVVLARCQYQRAEKNIESGCERYKRMEEATNTADAQEAGRGGSKLVGLGTEGVVGQAEWYGEVTGS